jgi:hypothetical protein
LTRYSKYTGSFDEVLRSGGIRIGEIQRRDRLGGLIHENYRDAA